MQHGSLLRAESLGSSCMKSRLGLRLCFCVLKGMFSEGLMHGQGTYIWADGLKYEVKCIICYSSKLAMQLNSQTPTGPQLVSESSLGGPVVRNLHLH